MGKKRGLVVFGAVVSSLFGGCGGDNSSDQTIDDFLPDLNPPTGEKQSVFAGVISAETTHELILGPASSGVVGDYYMRNSKARFVIQGTTAVVGVVPAGGNLVDAVPLAPDGTDLGTDHFGEVSIMYQLGRGCLHEEIEVVRDGSDGGVAVLQARGKTHHNDFLNIRGIGALPIQNDLVPEFPDQAECATTYILPPDSATLQTYFTIFNPTETVIDGPMGMLNDTGGEVAVFLPNSGYSRLGDVAEAVNSAGNSGPYMVWQAPDVAYGIIPRHEDLTVKNSSVVLLGVSLFMFGVDEFLDVLDTRKGQFFALEPGQGLTVQVDVFAGRDAAEVEEEYQRLIGGETQTIAGKVLWADDDSGASGARVGIFKDENGNGTLDEDDVVVTYVDAAKDGQYATSVPPGEYLARAEVSEKARSLVVSLDTTTEAATVDLALERPVRYDYRIVDDGDGDAPIPGRITVVGVHPVEPDLRTHGNFDRYPGIVATVFSVRGSSTDMGDGADPPIVLPPGSDYRIFVSRGTEWSVAEVSVSPQAGQEPDELEFRLRRVVDTSDYIASEYHVHSIGSPDSPIPNERRVATAVADGIEFYATTDHDYIVKHQPIIERLGLKERVRSIPGEEISPLVYGHFNAWPLVHEPDSPNGGAINWTNGSNGFAMLPREIFAAARQKGAEVVQVNHARKSKGSPGDVSQNFDRMGLAFDYEARTFVGDVSRMPVPPDWLRLPPEDGNLFSDAFNALEVWNGFGVADTNQDGELEISTLDVVMRDWFNFLSFGKNLTPIGSSDTHYEVLESMGMPRTFVRVGAGMDSPDSIAEGEGLTRSVLDNLSQTNGVKNDVILSDGPMLRLAVDGDTVPLGKVHDGTRGSITVEISVQSPLWAQIDTIELFGNNTPDIEADSSVLQPFACFTSRTELHELDPCGKAGQGGAGTLTVTRVEVAEGFERYEAQINVVVAPGDIPSRQGATGDDAWVVARVRGHRPIYPVFIGDLLTDQDVSTFVTGDPEEVDAAIQGQRVRPAAAIASPFFVDFDGGGYLAPFAPVQ